MAKSKGKIRKTKKKVEKKKLINELWKEFSKRVGTDFLSVLDFHTYSKMKMRSTDAVLKKPRLFKEIFIQTFGIGGWLVLINYLKKLCTEMQIDQNYILSWFGEEKEEFIF